MLNWIVAHAQIIGAMINLGMLCVWIVYLHVFVSNYRRQLRAKILINLGAGQGLEARCLVSNMSSDAIYLQSIIIDLELPGYRKSRPVTELEGLEEWESPSELNLWTRQGPLTAGQVRDMGSFRGMLAHALGQDPAAPGGADNELCAQIEAFEVTIIAVYGSEDLPVGARRRFQIQQDREGTRLRPQTGEAQQIRSRSERRAMKKRLEEELR